MTRRRKNDRQLGKSAYKKSPEEKILPSQVHTTEYSRQDGSALYDCPRCNFRDANPSETTKHLES